MNQRDLEREVNDFASCVCILPIGGVEPFFPDDLPSDYEGPAWKTKLSDDEVRRHWTYKEIDKQLQFKDQHFQKRDALALAFARVTMRVAAQLKKERQAYPFEIPLIHGILVLQNVPFCLVHEKAGAPWDIYTGIPVLAHLGVLPSQTLDQYVSGEKHVDCFNIPLFFDRKSSEMKSAV